MMDSVQNLNSCVSREGTSESEVFCHVTSMRQIVEPRLLRIESEIRSIGKTSVSMKEALERLEHQHNLMSFPTESKTVCNVDDRSRCLRDVGNSNFANQPLARLSEDIEDCSMQRRSVDMQTAFLKDVDSSINARLQPIITALEDIKQQLVRPFMGLEQVQRPGKLIDGHEPNAITLAANQEEIINFLRAEHVKLQQVDLPNLQESLRNDFRQQLQSHEVSMIQQFTELQSSVMNQVAPGQNQWESAQVSSGSSASNRSSPEHDQHNVKFARPLPSPISPGVKDREAISSQKIVQSKTSEAKPTPKSRGLLPTFDKWFSLRKGESNVSKAADGSIKVSQIDQSFAGVFIQDRNLEKISYRMEDFFHTTGCAQALVRSECFQNFTLVVVCMNALWVGIAQDHNPHVKLYDSRPVFIIVENFFCLYFTIELILRFVTFTSAHKAFRDGWFRFDFCLVVIMIVDTWVIMVLMQVIDGKSRRIPIAPFRTLRLLKLTRMARLMHAFPELVMMIRSMVRSVRAVFSMVILITLIIYVWGIIMHTLLKDEKQLNDRLFAQSQMDFSDMNNSMWILFMNGALLLDNSAPLLTQLVFGETLTFKIAGTLLLIFVFLTAFLVLQMLTGIFCDVVIQSREEHRNENDVRLIKQELTSMLKKIDDGDGKLTQAETLEFINSGNTKAVLKQMGINLIFFYQLQEIMFDRQPRIRMKDFLELILVCRSSNHATVETLAGGFCFIGREIERLQRHLIQGFQATKDRDDIQDYARKILVED